MVYQDDVRKVWNRPAGLCHPVFGLDFEYRLYLHQMECSVYDFYGADGAVHLEDFFPKHQPSVCRKPEVPPDDSPDANFCYPLACTNTGFKDPSALSLPGMSAKNQSAEGKGENSDYLSKMQA